MKVEVVREHQSHLPDDDDHPYRTGTWRPNLVEYTATDLDVEGTLPRDLNGVYLRNTENPLFPAIERYHPFDGDGMLHAISFADGAASYRNRLIDTVGLQAELEAQRPLFAGILEDPKRSELAGHGARTAMKDASSTDVVVHGGRALSSFYQCGDLYAHDPVTLEPQGRHNFGQQLPDWGVSAHTKYDPHTRQLLMFSYSKQAPYLKLSIGDSSGALIRQRDVPLPGPRLPHDMAFSDNYAIFGDFPLYWDPKLLTQGVHHARFFSDTPTRFGVVRRDGTGEIQWFEAEPTYVLHFSNAYEDGDELVIDGYFQDNPAPKRQPDDGPYSMLMRYVDVRALGARLHRWRLNLKTGACREQRLSDQPREFPSIDPRRAGRKYRYVYAMSTEPGWFLFNGLTKHDLQSGEEQVFAFPSGVYASETPFAPRDGSTTEDDGYLLTFTSDVNADRSHCEIFDARDIAVGPIARVRLPERICSGTHACWAGVKELAHDSQRPAPRSQ